jgi:hypothetical protein
MSKAKQVKRSIESYINKLQSDAKREGKEVTTKEVLLIEALNVELLKVQNIDRVDDLIEYLYNAPVCVGMAIDHVVTKIQANLNASGDPLSRFTLNHKYGVVYETAQLTLLSYCTMYNFA